MTHFDFIQETNRTLEPKFIQKIQSRSTAIFKVVEIPISAFITVLLCDEKKIQELNLSFRKIDKATDVLSWRHNEIEKILFYSKNFLLEKLQFVRAFVESKQKKMVGILR